MIHAYFRSLFISLFLIFAVSVYPKSADQPSEIILEDVSHYVQSGDYATACRMYKDIKNTKDSIAKKVYAREVKALRSTHQIDELYLENKQQQNTLLESVLLCFFVLILALLGVIYYLRIKTHRLAMAEFSLLEAKEQAERSEQEKSILLSRMSVELKESLDDLTHRLVSLDGKQEISIGEIEQDVEKLQRLMKGVTESERKIG